MKVKSVIFPTPIDECNLLCDNIDVFIKLEDEKEFCVTVATIEWIIQNMKNGFLEPGAPNIIVTKLQEDIIENAINKYASDDAYWLKVCSLSYGENIPVWVAYDLMINYIYKDDEFW